MLREPSSLVVSGVLALGALAGLGCGVPAQRPPDDVAPVPDDAQPIDAPRDARPPRDALIGVPDLQFVAAEMVNSVRYEPQVPFLATYCEVIEGCVGGAGRRDLLRFDTVTANRGTGDLIVGATPPPGQDAGLFIWSPCHMHHHVANYASYELVDGTGTVVTARKQAFCLEDDESVEPGAQPKPYSCTDQGISKGWADVYGFKLPCQWIDVTGIPHGRYTLRVVVNPLGIFEELDRTNNVFTVPVNI